METGKGLIDPDAGSSPTSRGRSPGSRRPAATGSARTGSPESRWSARRAAHLDASEGRDLTVTCSGRAQALRGRASQAKPSRPARCACTRSSPRRRSAMIGVGCALVESRYSGTLVGVAASDGNVGRSADLRAPPRAERAVSAIRGIGDGYAFQRLLWLLVGTVIVPTVLLSLFGVARDPQPGRGGAPRARPAAVGAARDRRSHAREARGRAASSKGRSGQVRRSRGAGPPLA